MRLADYVQVTITDRLGGVSVAPYDSRNLSGNVGDDSAAVRNNREKTAQELGIDPDQVVFMRQVHGAEVAYVTEPYGEDPPGLDAMLTDQRGLALGVLAADCTPVLIADAQAGIIGAAHAGRGGTTAGVVPALARAMAERGADLGRMTVLVGPNACASCYEVSAEIHDEAAAALPEARATTRQGTPAFDMRAAITAHLTAVGVTNIQHDNRCTIETPELYSYRREGTTGRFAGYIWLD